MRFLSLFSGIGAFDYGLEKAGWTCAGQCEIDPYCRAVLARHWPDLWRWEDVRTVTAESVRQHAGAIDAIAGGFPCQPHSVAGKRQGEKDPRNLWPEFARLIGELGPRWVVAENVPGIRTTYADRVLGDLETLGYTAWPLVVGADDIGAPHRRKRVWFVAYAEGSRCGPTPGDLRPGQQETPPLDQSRADQDGVGRLANPIRSRHAQRQGWSGHTESQSPTAERGGGCNIQWPARPGQEQHNWEYPRLVEFTVGEPTPGSAGGLVRSAQRRDCKLAKWANEQALRALGNAVVWVNAYILGLAIMETDKEG